MTQQQHDDVIQVPNKPLIFPIGAFLMIRLEYIQICQQDELEAKLLRIIEKYVDNEMKRLYQEANNADVTFTPAQAQAMPRNIWVPISYRTFMTDLFGTVTSENTLKKALKSLIDKKLIFYRFQPKQRYDAPEYRMHIPVLQMLLNVVARPGYQSLIPSIIDTLKNSPPQELTPSGCQELISSIEKSCLEEKSRVSNIDTNYKSNYDKSNGKSNTFVGPADAGHNGGNENTLPGFDLEETVKQPSVKVKPTKQASADVTQASKRQVIPKRPKPPTPEPTPEEVAAKAKEQALVARSTAIYNNIVKWRGYAFDSGGAVINERKYCKRLAEKYTDEQVERFYVHLTTKHFKWKQPSYRYKVGAYEIFTEAGSISQQLKASDKTASNGHMPAVGPVTFDEYGNPDSNAITYGRIKFDHAAQQWWDNAAGKYLPVVN